MTLAETTRSRTHRRTSAVDVFANVDWVKVLRLAVWVAFCVLLIVLA